MLLITCLIAYVFVAIFLYGLFTKVDLPSPEWSAIIFPLSIPLLAILVSLELLSGKRVLWFLSLPFRPIFKAGYHLDDGFSFIYRKLFGTKSRITPGIVQPRKEESREERELAAIEAELDQELEERNNPSKFRARR